MGAPGQSLASRAAVLLLVAGVAGCGGARRMTGDLDEVRAAGVLRVIVGPGSGERRDRGLGRIDEAKMLRELCIRLGVKLEWVQCRRNDQMLAFLKEGLGDLVVARFSPAALHREGVEATAAVDWVEDVYVAGTGSGIERVEDLAGRPLDVQRSTQGWVLDGVTLPPGTSVFPVPEELPPETILERVARGRYSATVVDAALVHESPVARRLEIIGAVAERRALVWGVREGSVQLRKAVDDFLFAEQVLARSTRTVSCRDLEDIRQAGVLRVVTRNSPTTCTVERGGLDGFEYDLAYRFARELGVRLDLAIPPPGEDPVLWLEQGYGDLAALHEPLAPSDEGRFLASRPYRHVDMVAVSSVHQALANAVEELGGLELAASRPVAELVDLLPLHPPPIAASLSSGADAFTALQAVLGGQAAVAVVDRDAARLELPNQPELVEGPTVLRQLPLVWIMNSSSPALARRVDAYLATARRSGVVRQLVASDLSSFKPYVPPYLPEVPADALSPYDEVLKWSAQQHQIDWRLLASLMYEESRFDPFAVGPGGSAGLFQLMPLTWNELGVEDPHHPTEAVEAGASYLRRLMDDFAELELQDQVAMAIASYNVGPRHVYDARLLAAQMGLDQDRWSRNVETAMIILDNPDVARAFPAGVCRCRRAAAYTRRILRRYAAYREQFPPG